MVVRYLVDAFSLSMLPVVDVKRRFCHVAVKELTAEEFCECLRSEVINAVGHQGTVGLINTLCNTRSQVSRLEVKLKHEDELLLVQILRRLPEGRVLTVEELQKLLEEKKIKFVKLELYEHFY